ncbi:MAG: hypothetical protein H0W44_01780 [Gammaproteobacteria bacterium]|nr:hypothetical protein [Gammaproteobacteria bacterium]
MNDITNKKTSNRTVVLLFALFSAPMFGAWYLYLNTAPGKPWGTTNHGELINPAQPLKEFNATNATNENLTLANLTGHWTIMIPVVGECAEVCQKNLYNTRQIRIALNKETERVQRVLLLQNTQQLVGLSEILKQHADLKIMIAPADQTLWQQLKILNIPLQDQILLIDPHANLMMQFAPTINPRDILKDLNKLLKISKIG